MWIHHYKVRGKGLIPVDMLRYDASYPRDTESAVSMVPSRFNTAPVEPRDIELTHVCDTRAWQPTDSRWRSFGWQVVSRDPAYKI